MDRFRSIGRPSVRPSVVSVCRTQSNKTKPNRIERFHPFQSAAPRGARNQHAGLCERPHMGDDPSSKSRFVNRENIFLKKRIKLWIESKLILFTHTKMTTKRRVCDSFCPSQCARAREIQRRNATSGAATKRGRHTTTRRPAEEHGHSNVTLHLGCI